MTEIGDHPTASTPANSGETRYVVLEHNDEKQSWSEVAVVSARSALAALRDAVAGDGSVDGTFVAVPSRSWNPVAVRAEKTVTLKFEEA